MCSLGVIVVHPRVKVRLKLVDGCVNLLTEGDVVELVLHCPVEPLADTVCLRALCLDFRVVDVLDGEVQLELVGLAVAAILGSPVREHPHHPEVVPIKEGYDAVVEHVCSHKGFLPVVQLGKSDFGIGVYDGLLVDVSHALDMSHIICVLGHKEAGVERLDLAVCLFLGLCLLQSRHLRFVKDYPLLLDFGRQCFQAFLKCLQIVAQPYGVYP